MINYNINKKDMKIYIREVGFSQSKIPFVLATISIPFTVYFMIIGFLVDSEALMFGYSLLFLSIFMTSVGVVNYSKLRRDIMNLFKDNEIIQYRFEFVQGQYTLYNVDTNEQVAYKSSDITKVVCKKNTIIVKLKDRKVVFFPNIDEIKSKLP
ncbi:MAG: hypothetical protein IKB27_02640 [Clostridia bacterium]|nr:hypothetical protein [Clostridia bacterium]